MKPLLAALGLLLALAAAGPTLPAAAAGEGERVLVMVSLPPPHYRPNAEYADAYGDSVAQAARARIVAQLARTNALTMVDSWPMPLIGVDCFVLAAPAGRSAEAVARRLSHQPGVAWSQPLNRFHTESAPRREGQARAPPSPRQWRLGDLGVSATGRGVRVAVIDSMIDRAHPRLRTQVILGRDFVSGHPSQGEAHGTAVAGVIAASAKEGQGLAGVAPGARLMALRACWQQGSALSATCDSLSLARALDFALSHQAAVINLSLAGPADQLLGALIDVAAKRGVSVVAAYDPDLPGGGFPASHPGVIAVDDAWRGRPPAGVYAAPGHEVLTTAPGGGWGLVNGSSFAAAHVSGLVALIDERRDGKSLRLVSSPGGAIDACASLSRTQPAACACANLCDRQALASSSR